MASNLIRWGGPALMLGGLLWVLTYLVEIIFGMTAGEAAYMRADVSASILVWLWGVLFMSALFFLGVGLLGVRARLEGRSKVLGVVGALLACVAIFAASINLVTLMGIFGEATANDGLGFLGVIGTLGGSLILGIAALRAKVLPRWARFVLMLTPFAFVPAIIVTIPLASVAPEYVVADFPFPVVGIVLATVGYALYDEKRDPLSKPRPAVR